MRWMAWAADAGRADTSASGRQFSIGTLTRLAIAGALAPCLIMAAIGLYYWVASERDAELRRISRYAETLRHNMDRELKGYLQIAEALAASRFLQRGDLASMNTIARDTASRVGGRFVIVSRDGQHLVNTLSGPGAKLQKSKNAASVDRAFAAKRSMVHDLVSSSTTNRLEFGVLAPVLVDQKERYVVAYIPPLESIRALLSDLVLPQGWFASVLDGQGRLAARSRNHEQFLGRLVSDSFRKMIAAPSGLVESVDLEGRSAFTAFQRSKLSDWTAVIWVPEEILYAPRHNALIFLTAACAATILLTLGIARLLSGAVSRPIQSLVASARTIGEDGFSPPVATGMAEANIIGRTLSEAAKRLALREEELANSARTLKQSERRYRELVEGLSDAVVWEGDPDTLSFTFVSDAAESLSGYPASRWITDKNFWLDHLHPDDREAAAAFCRQETQAGRDHEFEYRMLRADGRVIWVRDAVYISRSEDGRRVSRGMIVDITKRKAAEEVLRDSERRFREMTETAPVMIWMSDASGRCVHLNQHLRRFWNVENDDLANFDWSGTVHPEDQPMVGSRVVQALREHKPFALQARFRNASGEYRVLEANASPRFSVDGVFVGLIGVNVDVTDKISAITALGASEERLRVATDAAELGVFEWRILEDRALFENRRMHEIFGHDENEGHLSKQQFLESYIHPEDVEGFEQALIEGMSLASVFRTTCRIRRKSDGKLRWIECAGNFTNDADGAPVKLVGVVADITDRKRAEQDLLQSTALLRAVSDGANDMIFVKDRDGRFIFANPATAKIVRVPLDALLGSTGLEWTANREEAEAFLANDRRIMETGVAEIVEEVFSDNDGTRVFMSEKAPMVDREGRVVGLIGVSRDITQRKRAEEQTALLLREVSHRAKNMLAVAQAIVRQTSRELDPRTFADRVTARLAGLAASHDLLVANDWMSVDVRDLVETHLSHYSDLIGTRIRLEGPSFGLKPAAIQTLGMAIHELATNASKYGALSKETGTVDLSWRASEADGAGFEMVWDERGAPPVRKPERRGFGHSVIVRMVEHGLDARVKLEYRENGLVWHVRAPAAAVVARQVPVDGARLQSERA